MTIITKKKKFETYPKEGQQITKIIPKHTDMRHGYEQGQFYNLTIDSLLGLFGSGKFTKMEIQGSSTFLHKAKGIDQTSKLLTLSYPNELMIREIPDSTVVNYIANPAIRTKREEIKMYRTIHIQEEQKYQSTLKDYNISKEQMENATDVIVKELLMMEFAKLRPPTPPVSPDQKIAKLYADIRELQTQDQQQYDKALRDAQREPLSFSGSYERLLINGKNL